jgi:ABC-type nitrate/sulfonate/bicarbonate transport system substrate-binding protein
MRRAWILNVIGLTVVLLAGGLPAAEQAAAQGRSIVIGYQETPDWLLFVARDLRLFEKAGLSPTFVKFEASPPMIEAIRHGSLDLASVGSVAFLKGLSQGLDWAMIGINPEGAYSQGLVARRDGPIKTPTNLKGKRIGVFTGATAQFGLAMMLRQHGIRPDQVTVIHMSPEQQVEAMRTGKIDAAMVWEPWMQRMIHSANGRIVETEGNLGIYTNVDCYSARRDWIASHKDTALRFLRALMMAGDIVHKQPKLAHDIWARELGLKGAWAEAIFESVPPPLIHEWSNPRYTYSLVKGGPLYQRLDFLAHYMLREGFIGEPVDLNTSMDPSLIAELLKMQKHR